MSEKKQGGKRANSGVKGRYGRKNSKNVTFSLPIDRLEESKEAVKVVLKGFEVSLKK